MLEEPGVANAYDPPGVSQRTRRWTKLILLALVVALGGFIALVEIVERRLIDYATAEDIHADLQAGHFACDQAFFPRGRQEPINYSTATCQHGLTTVHIGVNQERGQWIGSTDHESHDPGEEAMVTGSNWFVSFEAPNARSSWLAREVQAIIGGEIVRPPSQED